MRVDTRRGSDSAADLLLLSLTLLGGRLLLGGGLGVSFREGGGLVLELLFRSGLPVCESHLSSSRTIEYSDTAPNASASAAARFLRASSSALAICVEINLSVSLLNLHAIA